MHSYITLIFLLPLAFGGENENLSRDEFKCSLPDVTSEDVDLDVTRFRSDFSKISEVKFPGLIGPLNERLICKIKCIDGNWVGPLCSSGADGRFQPVLRECLFKNDQPLLAISFKNSSIEKETTFPHGSLLTVRCRHFGRYKLKGEGSVRCDNGAWAPRLPECVPTTGAGGEGGAPPGITYSVVRGSAVVGAAGALLAYPDTTLRLACLSPRAAGDPDWSWTQALGHHSAGWSEEEGEKETHYGLTLTKMSARHSDQYTCTSPAGLTNTIAIRVVSVTCPALAVAAHGRLHGQGVRLGHAAHFSCQPGYQLNGSAVLTCMGDGRWSAPAPACVETACPPLALGPQLRAVEYNASGGGRAVFRCGWGYRLVGAPGLECDLDGVWSGAPPHCAPIYCPEPSAPVAGRVLGVEGVEGAGGRHAVGALVSFACGAGLRLRGERSVVCTEAGFWSHPPPFCVPPSQMRASDTIFVENTTLIHVDE